MNKLGKALEALKILLSEAEMDGRDADYREGLQDAIDSLENWV